MKNVNFGESRSKIKSATWVPFVFTYYPRLKALSKIIHKNLNLLYMNDKVKGTFTSRPMVSFRTSWKLSNYQVRAKLYPFGRTVGSRKCKNCCEVCENVQNSDIFWSSATSEMLKINDRMTSDDKCLVYLFKCKTCSKQYAGETTE